jgi:hypothetical protein
MGYLMGFTFFEVCGCKVAEGVGNAPASAMPILFFETGACLRGIYDFGFAIYEKPGGGAFRCA